LLNILLQVLLLKATAYEGRSLVSSF